MTRAEKGLLPGPCRAHIKKNGPGGPFYIFGLAPDSRPARTNLGSLDDVGCLRAFGAVNYIELNRVPFAQTFKAFPLDSGKMHV